MQRPSKSGPIGVSQARSVESISHAFVNRIAIVCVSLRAGGTERVVSRFANFLSEANEVILILLSAAPMFYRLSRNVKVIQPEIQPKSELGPAWYPKIASYLCDSLRNQRPDVLLCFGESIAPLVIPISRLNGVRVMVFNRASPLSSLKGLRGLLNPITYPLASRVVVQTARATHLMRRRYRLSRFEVLPNPVDIDECLPTVQHRASKIVNVGTLGGSKNQSALIRVFSKLKRKDSWALDFVGDGPDREILKKEAHEMDIGRFVRFHGQRSDVAQILGHSAIFAFTSLTEGFPNALAEAMTAGCACISYDCPTGPSELIEPGFNGFLVEPGDELAYARLLQQLIDDPDLRARFSENAQKSMKRFSAAGVLARLDDMIRKVVEEPNHKVSRTKGS